MSDFAQALVPVAFFALIGFMFYTCDGTSENIRQCASACEKSEQKMTKYNPTDGCVCVDK